MDTQAKKILSKVWAEDSLSNRISDGEGGSEWPTELNRGEGWGIEYEQNKFPERKVWNQLLREIQGACRDHMQYGVVPWVSDIAYPQYSFVQYSGSLYYALEDVEEGQNNPASNSSWRLY